MFYHVKQFSLLGIFNQGLEEKIEENNEYKKGKEVIYRILTI